MPALAGTTPSFCAVAGMEPMAPGAMTEAGTGSTILAFEADDVDRWYERPRSRVPVVEPITQP
jgi:hypothetical protein